MSAPAIEVVARVANRSADLRFTAEPGTTTAIVGPNGAGKSTLLQLISGQLRPDVGHVRLGGRQVGGDGVHVPTHRRRVAVLEQQPMLFEHLNVLDNVAFGLRAHGVRPNEARARARAELDSVGCAPLADRRAWEVSGGQAQRIALARALATDPEVVLLDEPLAALDVSVAPTVRSLLRQRLRDACRTTVLVTHDAIDALSLADDLVLVEGGRVVGGGPVADQLARPRHPFLAEIVDLNLLRGVVASAASLDLPGGVTVTGLAHSELAAGSPGLASFAPDAVAVHAEPPGGSLRNHFAARVIAAEPRGPLVRLRCQVSDGTPVAADITLGAAAEGNVAPGASVWLVVKAAQVTLYPR
ncbi:MAG: ABC transporter ATP-binding protein [Propionibacteriaceae bacterium]|nr:ABC transporter ATP-binding protein [Propionibacteriaceae bacterium]